MPSADDPSDTPTSPAEGARSERYERGRALLSQIHAAPGEEIVDGLDDLGELIVEFAFGDIYSRPGLSLRDRQLATVAMLAAKGGCEPQLDVHLQASLNVGLTREELREVLIQVAPYAGFPAAMNALNRLKALEEKLESGRAATIGSIREHRPSTEETDVAGIIRSDRPSDG